MQRRQCSRGFLQVADSSRKPGFCLVVAFWVLVSIVPSLSATRDTQVSKHRTDSTPSTLCDKLAADPEDENRVEVGKWYYQIDIDSALVACRAALESFPSSPRLHYELGRLLLLSKDYGGAGRAFKLAADRAYGIASARLGDLLWHNQISESETDRKSALSLYREAAAAGNRYGGATYSFLKIKDVGFEVDVTDENWRELTQSAEAGSPAAEYALGSAYLNRTEPGHNDEAVAWMTRAAESGQVDAMKVLGMWLGLNSKCGSRAYLDGLRYLEKAESILGTQGRLTGELRAIKTCS